LSAFRIGQYRFTQIFNDGWQIGDEKPMNIMVDRLFKLGLSIPYEYDFGTTSELTIKVVDERIGQTTTDNPIALMARNKIPVVPCMQCGQPATYTCIQCMYEREDGVCELCGEHAKTHPHDDYGEPMPFVNSPRTGMCGYEGPAEPPY
jgi:hypothetical protein